MGWLVKSRKRAANMTICRFTENNLDAIRQCDLKLTMAVLPPQISTPTRSPGAGTYSPEVSAASAAAPRRLDGD